MKNEAGEPDPTTIQSWSMNFAVRTRTNSDTLRSIDMSWDGLSAAQVMDNLNTFLTATGVPLKVVRGK